MFTKVLDNCVRVRAICLGLDTKSHYLLELCLCNQTQCDNVTSCEQILKSDITFQFKKSSRGQAAALTMSFSWVARH